MHENYAVLWKRIADQRPDDVAVSEGGLPLSYGDFDRQAACVAGALRARGVAAGDRVAFFLHNTVEYLIGFYACLKLEAIPVSINYRYRAGEVAELLAASRPAVLVFSAANRQAALDASGRLGAGTRPRLLVEAAGAGPTAPTTGAEGADVVPFGDLLDAAPASLPEPGADAELYIFTGGTTGTPKAVVWGIGSLLDIQQSSIYPPVGLEPPEDLAAAVGLAVAPDRPRVVTLPLAPFIHATALFSAMNTLALGGTVVIYPEPGLDADAVAELIVRDRVTRLIVAGDAVAVPILDALEERADDAAVALDSVISSGMRFSDDTKRRLHRLGRVAIVDILASTEGGPYAMAVTRHEDELPARFRLVEEAAVLDDHGCEVQDRPGATGILSFRGSLPKGYLDDPTRTAQAYPVINGVRHVSPGDYVRVLQDRYIELLGRGSAVVNTGGEKVYPAEVEEALLDHPAVTDAVVFGLPDERWGEKVAAVVALEPGATLAEEDLLAFVGERLAGYKKPRRLELRGRLERSPTGKLDMAALRESLDA
jgi:3-oxocholest-4-en-26-oate---CoA ligase